MSYTSYIGYMSWISCCHHRFSNSNHSSELAMIENVMNNMGGVGVYGFISICLFFAFFIGVLVWTICLKKPYLKSMRELPLDGEPAPEPGVEPTPNPEDHHD